MVARAWPSAWLHAGESAARLQLTALLSTRYMMADQPLCCLCRLVTLEKRKRKKLNGESCLKAKAILQELSDVPLDFFVQTSNPDAVLCNTCEKLLLNVCKVEEKLKLFKHEVIEKLESLTHVRAQGRCHRKRQHVTNDSTVYRQSKRTSTQIPDPLTTSVSDEHSAVDHDDRVEHLPSDDTIELGEYTSASEAAQTPGRNVPSSASEAAQTPGRNVPLLVS